MHISVLEWLNKSDSHWKDVQNTSRWIFLVEWGCVYDDAQHQKISVTQLNLVSERIFLSAYYVTVQNMFVITKDSDWNCKILTNNGNSKCFQREPVWYAAVGGKRSGSNWRSCYLLLKHAMSSGLVSSVVFVPKCNSNCQDGLSWTEFWWERGGKGRKPL